MVDWIAGLGIDSVRIAYTVLFIILAVVSRGHQSCVAELDGLHDFGLTEAVVGRFFYAHYPWVAAFLETAGNDLAADIDKIVGDAERVKVVCKEVNGIALGNSIEVNLGASIVAPKYFRTVVTHTHTHIRATDEEKAVDGGRVGGSAILCTEAPRIDESANTTVESATGEMIDIKRFLKDIGGNRKQNAVVAAVETVEVGRINPKRYCSVKVEEDGINLTLQGPMLRVEILNAIKGSLSAPVELEEVGLVSARRTEKQDERQVNERFSQHRDAV